MNTKTFGLNRLALTALGVLCLGATVTADPFPMYMMIDGRMMTVTPMTKDVTLKNGCKVCVNGAVIWPHGKRAMVKNGDMVSGAGVVIPSAKLAHGG